METAKIFTNGGSQAVRLPKECRLEGLSMFTPDFLQEDIEDLPLQERSFL